MVLRKKERKTWLTLSVGCEPGPGVCPSPRRGFYIGYTGSSVHSHHLNNVDTLKLLGRWEQDPREKKRVNIYFLPSLYQLFFSLFSIYETVLTNCLALFNSNRLGFFFHLLDFHIASYGRQHQFMTKFRGWPKSRQKMESRPMRCSDDHLFYIPFLKALRPRRWDLLGNVSLFRKLRWTAACPILVGFLLLLAELLEQLLHLRLLLLVHTKHICMYIQYLYI